MSGILDLLELVAYIVALAFAFGLVIAILDGPEAVGEYFGRLISGFRKGFGRGQSSSD